MRAQPLCWECSLVCLKMQKKKKWNGLVSMPIFESWLTGVTLCSLNRCQMACDLNKPILLGPPCLAGHTSGAQEDISKVKNLSHKNLVTHHKPYSARKQVLWLHEILLKLAVGLYNLWSRLWSEKERVVKIIMCQSSAGTVPSGMGERKKWAYLWNWTTI